MPTTDFGNVAECGVTSPFIPSFFFSFLLIEFTTLERKRTVLLTCTFLPEAWTCDSWGVIVWKIWVCAS